MFMIGPIGFAAPWLLAALVALPILWLLLRAVPPAPIRRRFPGVALLLGLTDDQVETDKTPWWLLLLRMAAVGGAIAAFAGPVLNPTLRAAGNGPLLVLVDGGWAEASDWSRRVEKAGALIDEATREGRLVAVARLADKPAAVAFDAGGPASSRVATMVPAAWVPGGLGAWMPVLPDGPFDTYWLSDGLDHSGRSELMAGLTARGSVTVFQTARPVFALHPPGFADGVVTLRSSRMPSGAAFSVDVIARGPDPAGIERELARVPMTFGSGAIEAKADLTLPPELRNRITRFEIAGQRSAGAVSLTDDSLKRRKVAIVASRDDREGLRLLSPTHYLREALAPVADLIDGGLTDQLLANPDVLILADVARLTQTESDAVLDWLEKGGLLLRFAGPQLAASDVARSSEDPLIPVRLREGGRSVGGAMSWGEPKALAPFPEGSPFFGLVVPDEVTVNEQVLAQPDPDLANRTIAALADGTPLVTRKTVGDGQVVLFHVTANAQWSNLPLSGLYVQMLERLAVSTRAAVPDGADLAGQIFVPEKVLDGFGQPQDAGALAGVEGTSLAGAIATGPGPDLPPGLYAGPDRRVALNAVGATSELTPAVWAADTAIEGIEAPAERSLKGLLLSLALALLLIDVLAALAVSGKLRGAGRVMSVLVLGMFVMAQPGPLRAQDAGPEDPFALEATRAVVLAYVKTGDTQIDDVSAAGLRGLGDRLWERTSVEPAEPMGVDIETDELAFFPFLYWPVTGSQPTPSAAAYVKLNAYLRTGGLILFDTRDGDVAGLGGATPEARALQQLAAGLDVPALEPIPKDHVLTRSFYLLQTFPGRHIESTLWVEAASMDAEQAEGMPFRNLNDGVTPIVIGGNDWASAWATDATGVPMRPVGRGFAGERQREMAYRFGINLIMHVLTGNYKSDQVHVPALLERLGQ
jgi:Domain of unknown function (DUF4159)/Aerotolerance regulator N-terminal